MSNQERTVQLLMESGQITPTTVTKARKRHQRAVFKNDVRPFASGMGWASALAVSGAIIAAGAFVTLLIQTAGHDQTFLQPELFIAAAGAGALAYGIGYAAQLSSLKGDFTERLFNDESEATHFSPNNDKDPAVFVRLDHNQTRRIPTTLPIKDLRRYIESMLVGQASLSEASAANHNLSRRQWETFKEWALSAGFIRWLDEENHRAGLEIAGPGGRTALTAIARGYYHD